VPEQSARPRLVPVVTAVWLVATCGAAVPTFRVPWSSLSAPTNRATTRPRITTCAALVGTTEEWHDVGIAGTANTLNPNCRCVPYSCTIR
jgi:hypothetical protein